MTFRPAKLPGVMIVDYGVGNLASLTGALERCGYQVSIARCPKDLEGSEAIVLPGVGAFDYAMNEMKRTGLDDAVKEAFKSGQKPILGICLGMQLFFEHSEEGDVEGLALLPGYVRGFADRECHVGWNLAHSQETAQVEAYYFNHSFYADCSRDLIRSYAHFQRKFPVIVEQGCCVGVQFHPEKSQAIGQALLKSVLERRPSA